MKKLISIFLIATFCVSVGMVPQAYAAENFTNSSSFHFSAVKHPHFAETLVFMSFLKKHGFKIKDDYYVGNTMVYGGMTSIKPDSPAGLFAITARFLAKYGKKACILKYRFSTMIFPMRMFTLHFSGEMDMVVAKYCGPITVTTERLSRHSKSRVLSKKTYR